MNMWEIVILGRYAAYYGEDYARQAYGAYAPPVGTAPPAGTVLPAPAPAPAAAAADTASTSAPPAPAPEAEAEAEVKPEEQEGAPPSSPAS